MTCACVCACVSVYVCACESAFVCVCLCECIFLCVHVCVYILDRSLHTKYRIVDLCLDFPYIISTAPDKNISNIINLDKWSVICILFVFFFIEQILL